MQESFFIKLWFQLRSFYLWASPTCLRVMTLEQRIFTRLLFCSPLIHFTFFDKCLCSCKGDSNTGLGCMAPFVVVFAPPLFFKAFSTWAELQVQLVCVITSGSCSSELSPGWDDRLQRQKTATPTRPPLPFLLSTLQHDWRLLIGIGVMLLTPFMHLSLPHSNLYETGVQWRNGEPADCPLKDAISSVQFSSAVMTYTGYT